MSGLTRFDFYPRDWFLDTRELSNAAKGVYVDLLCAMYARGGPLPWSERDLCGLCGCRTVRSFRPLIEELLAKEKLRVENSHLVNGRTMEEIAVAQRKIDDGRKGGKARAKAVRREYKPNTTRTRAETEPGFVEKQPLNPKLPSPSPSSVSKDTEAEPQKIDVAGVIFGQCRQYLQREVGLEESAARKLLGRLRKSHRDGDIVEAFTAAQQRPDIQDPVPWIIKALNGKPKNRARPGAHRPGAI